MQVAQAIARVDRYARGLNYLAEDLERVGFDDLSERVGAARDELYRAAAEGRQAMAEARAAARRRL